MRKRFFAALIMAGTLHGAAVAVTKSDDARRAIRAGNERVARAEYEQAIAAYRLAFGAPGGLDAAAHYNVGVCHYELYRSADAVAQYGEAIKSRGGVYPKASYALGVALEDLRRPGEARAAYRQALDASGGLYAEAHYRLGVLDAQEGRYESAAALFRTALAVSRDRLPAGHNNLGVMLAFMGRYAEAAREFEIALRQEGGRYEDARRNLSLCRTLIPPGAARQSTPTGLTGPIGMSVGGNDPRPHADSLRGTYAPPGRKDRAADEH